MKRCSASNQGKETEEEPHQQCKHFQHQCDSTKQLKPRTLYRSSTDSRVMIKSLYLNDHSPRTLMSSLQNRKSPLDGGGVWKVRYNDLALEEILRERRAAIESGKLKGRRLFEAAEGASEVGSGENQEIIFGGREVFVHDHCNEVRSVFSYDSDDGKEYIESKEEELYPVDCHSSSCASSSYICDDCIEVAVANERYQDMSLDRWKFIKGWLPIALILLTCAIGITSVKMLCGNGKAKEVILVPT